MDEYGAALVRAIDLLGIFAFALSGGWLALKRGMDLVGVTALAVTAGLFGGLIRDILTASLPPQLVVDDLYLVVPLLAVLVVVLIPKLAERRVLSVLVLDAIGMGLFAAIGGSKAAAAGLGLLGATFTGTVAAVGGGVLRDLFAAGIPEVFLRQSNLYVIPAVVGSFAAAVVATNGAAGPAVLLAVAAGTASFRLLAVRYHWHAPVPNWMQS